VCGFSLPLFGQDANTPPADQTADNESKDTRLPVPSGVAVKETMNLVQDIYKSEIQKAKTPAQKQALAKKLLADGVDTNDDPTGRYVLFQLARDLAAESGDVDTALEVLDQMSKGYKIDALEEQAKVFTQAAKKIRSNELRRAVVNLGLRIIDRAIIQDKYALANRVAVSIIPVASKTKDYKLFKLLTARKKQIGQLVKKYGLVQKALAALERNPTHPKANQAVGEFRCFLKGDWVKGLPMLALGDDKASKSLAIADLKAPSTSSESSWEMGGGIIPRKMKTQKTPS